MTQVTQEHLDSEIKNVRKDIDHLKKWLQGAITVGLVFFAAFAWQIDKQYDAQQETNKTFLEQQKQFNATLEKIGQVDKQSLQRDHELELKISSIAN